MGARDSLTRRGPREDRGAYHDIERRLRRSYCRSEGTLSLIHVDTEQKRKEGDLEQGTDEGGGAEAYDKEGLREEVTSMTVNGVMRLPHDPERHASYVDPWIKVLKDDSRERCRYVGRTLPTVQPRTAATAGPYVLRCWFLLVGAYPRAEAGVESRPGG